jgi:4-hydroxybenzoate polyprenyltransferase
LATQLNSIELDWRLLSVVCANILVVAYAFMINDIEDAPDDAIEADRASRNPIACGEISARTGYAACGLLAVVAMVLYLSGGTNVFLIGLLTLVLSHLYSWRPVRLKAWAILDLVSHSLMLSGLLLLAGYFIYHDDPGPAWLVFAAATLVSVYGQFYNQVRDFDMDTKAGLHNTAILLGKKNAQLMMYLALVLAGICLLGAIVQEVFPVWLIGALLAGVAVSFFFKPSSDSRGTEAIDPTGAMQNQALIVINVTVGLWLVYVIAEQLSIF